MSQGEKQIIGSQNVGQLPAEVSANQLPAHLIPAEGGGGLTELGLDILAQYTIPPRLKVVQPQSGGELRQNFNYGDVIISPNNQLLAPVILTDKGKPTENGEPFYVCPLFFFPEFLLWNPIETKDMTYPDGEPMYSIRDRSIDPNSDIARHARTANLREFQCPELPSKKCRYQEHLNFVVMVMASDFYGVPMIVSFFKSEHKTGTRWSSDLRMKRTYIYGTQWQLRTAMRRKDQYEWYGFNVTAPSPGSGISPYIDNADEFAAFKQLHLEFKQIHAEGLLLGVSEEDAPGTFDNTATNVDPNAPRQF